MSLHKRINRFLANWVSAINALVAVGLPVALAVTAGGLAGIFMFGGFSLIGFLGGLIAGAVIGVLVAGPLCGVLALLIDIRNALASQGGDR